jgi:hypothetical protein
VKISSVLILLAVVLLFLPLIVTLSYMPKEGEITPNDEFFVVSIGSTPDIDVNDWEMEITGEIVTPLNLTYTEILDLNSTMLTAELQCVDGPSDTALWEGVRLNTILGLVGLTENASDIVFFGADGYNSSLSVEEALKDNVLLAYGMNDEVLPANQGFPLRVVAPGLYGYKWVKWIERIEIVNFNNLGYWESRGWQDDASIERFSAPLAHAYLFSGAFIFAGLSFISGNIIKNPWNIDLLFVKLFGKKTHWVTSILFLCTSLIVYFYWELQTFKIKGGFINTLHGIIALFAMILSISAAISGIRFSNGKRNKEDHYQLGSFAFWAFLVNVVVGIFVLNNGNFI